MKMYKWPINTFKMFNIFKPTTREMQIKTSLRLHLTQSEWQPSRKQKITNAGEDAGKKEPSYGIDGNVNYSHHDGNQSQGFSKN
jgi:hypothetical protein